MFTFDEHYLSPHQHSDVAVSTVPHQYPDAAAPTIDDFHVPYNDVKGQLDIVYKYVDFTKARDRHAQWLEKNMHPADVMRRLKFLYKKKQLIVQIPTFRLIYYVDQYSKKHPSSPMKLLGILKIKNYDEEAVIKSVCLPNMDKKVIDQTSGMVKVQDSESDSDSASASASASQKNFEAALMKVQQYAKTRLTQGLIQSWLDDRLSVATVIVRLGLSPKALDTAYDFSRYKILVMYEINWNLQHRPKTFTSLQANALMKLWGYTLEDFKTLHEKSDKESALSLALKQWIRTQENGNANVSGKKRKEREF
ncbi:hypothetical protein DD238_007088 [Peronospora effusa]|uniref:Uncharacterized protein n=1 Tax=Peronospora effusa TaxID=542832 RepID=A0A3M6V848_9STRA|nr:hypothetical protein DD238_007088 [Peronospora effusa]